MTDLTSPPEDPLLQLAWARRVLREFWRPENRGLLGAKEIRAMAREIIKAHKPPRQSNQPQLPLT
jgi:hypothetical protein